MAAHTFAQASIYILHISHYVYAWVPHSTPHTHVDTQAAHTARQTTICPHVLTKANLLEYTCKSCFADPGESSTLQPVVSEKEKGGGEHEKMIGLIL